MEWHIGDTRSEATARHSRLPLIIVVAYSHWQGPSRVADLLIVSPHLAVVGDSNTSNVIVFDPADESPGRNVVEYGPGPGEIDGVGSISRFSDGFAVSDASGRRVLIFDAHSRLLSTTSTSCSCRDLSALGLGFVATPFYLPLGSLTSVC